MNLATTITIHLVPQPNGGVTVLTTAPNLPPGRFGTIPLVASLGFLLLQQAEQVADEVRYWESEDPALAFVQSCLDPEGNGFAVNSYVRDQARQILGRMGIDTAKPTPPSEVPA